MHYLLTPIGSAGDLLPFVGIGRALRIRGHDVTLLGPEPFRRSAESVGLKFATTWSDHDFQSVTHDPSLWHPRKGLRLVLQAVAGSLRHLYELISEHYQPERTTLVGHTLALATRVFEDRHGAPAATIHLAPTAFRSEHSQPGIWPGIDITGAPRWLKRTFWRLVDGLVIDPHIAAVLNEFRYELGLAPVRRIFNSWLHSPQRVIGMFPDWFFRPQPDWPAQLRITGFPLFDNVGNDPLEAALDAFLADGEPPIVFTPGSANRQAPRFFKVGVEAATRLGRRALLITPYAEQLPRSLPSHIEHVTHVPFSSILPRCAAIVHHGGIGTCAQGLAAGIPQLTMPMGFDQPDNAMRLARLGVGAYLFPRHFRIRPVAGTLRSLLESRETAYACRRFSEAIASVDAIGATSDLLESLPSRQRATLS